MTFDASAVIAAIDAFGHKAKDAAQAAVVSGASLLMERAMPNVPYAKGTLAGSAFVQAVDDGAEGGFSDPKAAAVHEIPARHDIGSHKFLERAVNESSGEAIDAVAAAFSAVLAGGTAPASAFPSSPPTVTVR